MSEPAPAPRSGHDRRFAGFAAACAAATVTVFLVDTLAAPEAQRPGHLAVAALLAATVLLAFLFLRRGFAPRVLMAAGAMFMVLGVAAAFKPQILWFVPLALLMVREWRTVVGMLIGGLGSLALSLAIVSPAQLGEGVSVP